jgi:hypothetical protein
MCRTIFLASLLLISAVFSAPSHAILLNQGDSALYSFSASGTGPFPSIKLTFSFPNVVPDAFDSSDEMSFSVYDELGDPALFSFGPISGFSGGVATFDLATIVVPPLSDNNGYVLIENVKGLFDILSLMVQLGTGSDIFINPQFGSPVVGQLVTTQVSEPSSFMATVSAIGLLGFVGWRRKSK